MSYYIDIIDTTSPLVQIVPKASSASGIALEWVGGDSKDNMTIVGSNLKFDMLTVDDTDMAFVEFFSGDEHRFKTQVRNSADDSIIWQGYILPDLYSEPYKNGKFFVSFTASDGLGRLKGKFLTDEYYNQEKSLIDIYCQILRLTGIDLELFFAPAIENFIQKDWNKIYIDTESFIDGQKKKDAYAILETLLADTLCICYQCDNRWYVEGINMRHLRRVTYKNYDSAGNLIGNVVYDRILKAITALDVPQVTIIPPYNEITVSHKKTAASLPDTVSNETNDGWAVVTGVVGTIYASEWMSHGDYNAICISPGYFTTIYNQYYFDGNNATTWTQDDTKYISLRKQLYFEKDNKVKFALNFNTVHRDASIGGPGTPATWLNVFKYEIIFNGVVLFSNFGGLIEDRENLVFNDSGECKIEIEHVFAEEGIIDIRLYRPIGRVADNGVLGIKLSSASVTINGFNDTVEETDLINGDFTIDKSVELTYAEDNSGFSNAFRLSKLKEATSTFNEIEVPILYGFNFDSKHYTVVQLAGANLIKENKYQVYHSSALVRVNNVIYNWENGEQMVVETDVPYTSGSFFVKKYAIETATGSRTAWSQWTDAFYKIENVSYIKTVCNIYRRMFNVTHEKLDVQAFNAVKFNDLIQFRYVFMKDFIVLNCSWNLDENKTNLVLGRSNYKDSTGTNPTDANIPPIVIAGNDIYITGSATTASLLAAAYDPDGFIVSQIWTKIVGGAGDVIVTPTLLGTNLTNLTEDLYTYQIQVIDNNGATAVDTVNIIRTKDYTVSLDLTDTVYSTIPGQTSRPIKKTYKLNITPALLPGYILTFTGLFHLYAKAAREVVRGPIIPATAWYNIEKNGITIEGNQVDSTLAVIADIKDQEFPMILNMISTDEIYFVLYADPKTKRNYVQDYANFHLQTAVIAAGVGTVVGLPINVEVPI